MRRQKFLSLQARPFFSEGFKVRRVLGVLGLGGLGFRRFWGLGLRGFRVQGLGLGGFRV